MAGEGGVEEEHIPDGGGLRKRGRGEKRALLYPRERAVRTPPSYKSARQSKGGPVDAIR